MATKTFMLPRGSKAAVWVFTPLGVLLLAFAACFAYFVIGSKHLEVGVNSVELKGAFYGATVPRGKVLADQARVVDLDQERALAPGARTNGLDLFSYKEGWFRLHSGEKAMVVVSNENRVIYIPTSAGYSLLFSPAGDPDEVLAALKGP